MNQALAILLFFFTCFFICVPKSICQIKQFEVTFVYGKQEPGKDVLRMLDDFNKSNLLSDSLLIRKNFNQLQNAFYERGYLEFSIDSLHWADGSVVAHLFVGRLYEGLVINGSNLDEKVLNTIGINKSSYENRVVSPTQLKKLSDRILRHFENSGYPFAEVGLNEINFIDNRIGANVQVTKNMLVTIDSVVVKGNSKINPKYIYSYLNLKPGDVYNESIIQKIANRIKELSFINAEKESQVYFRNNKARVYLYLKDKKVSTIDGILGLQSDRENKKVNLTGEVKLFLSNSFSHGEKLKFHWKQPRKLTQSLEVEINYPFLLSTPFGIDAELEIYKQDTTYLDLKQIIGVQYVFSGNDFLEAFVEYNNSTLLSTSNFGSLTALPEWADISNTNYGLRLNIEKLDYKFNPRKGWQTNISIAVGTKNIEQNSKLNEELYDSLILKSNQYQANLKANYFLNIYKRNVLNFRINSAVLLGDDIFSNQLYRIGGLNSLRGFDEESLLATTYSILTIEYRYLLEQNAYFMLFVNGAYYEADSRNNFVKDTPIGFGTGIAFETKLGIFNLNYALGQQFSNPIFFRDAKLHFGIVNYF